MENFDMELGDTLEGVLKFIKVRSVTIGEFSTFTGIDVVKTAAQFKALRQRGYIACYRNALLVEDISEDPTLTDRFKITENGRNYLELQKRIWHRFRLQSIYVPFGVALLTSILVNAFAIWSKLQTTP